MSRESYLVDNIKNYNMFMNIVIISLSVDINMAEYLNTSKRNAGPVDPCCEHLQPELMEDAEAMTYYSIVIAVVTAIT